MDLHDTDRNVLKGNVFSVFYTQFILLYLYYSDRLYKIADSENLVVVYAIILLEIVKYFLFGFPKTRAGKSRDNPLKDFMKSVIIFLAMIVVYSITAVLFGAPILSEWNKTFMFGLILASVSVIPLCLNLGPDLTVSVLTSLNVSYSNNLIEQFLLNFKITLFGAWLGAIVIPLDWDRPWQVWPLPCCIGSVVGCGVANLITIFSQLKLNCSAPSRTRKII